MTSATQAVSLEGLITSKQEELKKLHQEIDEKQQKLSVLHQELSAAQMKYSTLAQELNGLQSELHAKSLQENWKAWIDSFLRKYPDIELHYRTNIYRSMAEAGVKFVDEKTGELIPTDTQHRKVNEYLWSLTDGAGARVRKGNKRGTFVFISVAPMAHPIPQGSFVREQLALPVPFFPPPVNENRFSEIREEVYQSILNGGFTPAMTAKQTFLNRCRSEGLNPDSLDLDFMNSYLDERCQSGGTLQCFKKHLGISGVVSTDHGYQRAGLPAPGDGWVPTVPALKQKIPPIRRRKPTNGAVVAPPQVTPTTNLN